MSVEEEMEAGDPARNLAILQKYQSRVTQVLKNLQHPVHGRVDPLVQMVDPERALRERIGRSLNTWSKTHSAEDVQVVTNWLFEAITHHPQEHLFGAAVGWARQNRHYYNDIGVEKFSQAIAENLRGTNDSDPFPMPFFWVNKIAEGVAKWVWKQENSSLSPTEAEALKEEKAAAWQAAKADRDQIRIQVLETTQAAKRLKASRKAAAVTPEPPAPQDELFTAPHNCHSRVLQLMQKAYSSNGPGVWLDLNDLEDWLLVRSESFKIAEVNFNHRLYSARWVARFILAGTSKSEFPFDNWSDRVRYWAYEHRDDFSEKGEFTAAVVARGRHVNARLLPSMSVEDAQRKAKLIASWSWTNSVGYGRRVGYKLEQRRAAGKLVGSPDDDDRMLFQ